jgi:hypothetical protein
MEQPKTATGVNEAGTNVEAFIQDLDGGMFEKKLSIALSEVAAATCDNKDEEHKEHMAGELADLIKAAITDDIPVMIGKYEVK